MENSIYLCMVLHNHQPIGNFEGVIEQAYQDSYRPFLDVFEPFEHVRIALHTSGPLMSWLDRNHPEYIDRLRRLVAAGRIEIVGGPFYEPILTMIPGRDRRGQILRFQQWLEQRFDTRVSGMWMPERVWETRLVADLAAANTQYTILDDFHFRAAGLTTDQLTGYFVTEDGGAVLRIFPGSERLRYLIPFADPELTIEYARSVAKAAPGAILVFGDDGEKFGTWPDTKSHVYDHGWLRRFLTLLTENRAWFRTTTPAEMIASHPPTGRVYLPDCSYREMTEWSLPQPRQEAFDEIIHSFQHHPQWAELQQFLRGGFWNNFRVKYSEANEMYSRMLEISDRIEAARYNELDDEVIGQAEDHLYRGQCNCPYWHGAFGGIYLPHLRNANYRELIAADNLLSKIEACERPVDATAYDYDHDLYKEIRISNSKLIAYVAPAQGGIIYELDIRSIEHNLLASMQRRPETYHKKIAAAATQSETHPASIHDRMTCKQANLDSFLQYDEYPRKCLRDHIWHEDCCSEDIALGRAKALGDFALAPFDARIRRSSDRVEVIQVRESTVHGMNVTLQKSIVLRSDSDELECSYCIHGLRPGYRCLLGVELNFAGMPSKAHDRFFYDEGESNLGHLGERLILSNQRFLGLIDQWLGLDVQWSASQPATLNTYPVETVSQSESGLELIHQSVCLIPVWRVLADVDGSWSVQFRLAIRHSHVPCVVPQSALSQSC